jgi:hypothetical protein
MKKIAIIGIVLIIISTIVIAGTLIQEEEKELCAGCYDGQYIYYEYNGERYMIPRYGLAGEDRTQDTEKLREIVLALAQRVKPSAVITNEEPLQSFDEKTINEVFK